jgi:hypothetical protein
MKRKIDIQKINLLLKNNSQTKKELALFINCPESNLCAGLSVNSKRTLSMDYIVEIADFFSISPVDITIPFDKSITSKQSDKLVPTQGEE